jgi:L-2,4-diaminobutyric acid acetyltransferase
MSQVTNTVLPDTTIRRPEAADGLRVHELIDRCRPLDPNSIYCNLLQCTHFADTCAIAEDGGGILGWVSGYIEPDKADTLFIWQIAVSDRARGQGLSKKLLRALLARSPAYRVRFLETTITESNKASWGLFQSFANELEAKTETVVFFDKQTHFGGLRDSEILLRIGPFR